MEDPVDPKPILEEKCRQSVACQPYLQALQECSERVETTEGTTENCGQELGDLLKCSDQCVNWYFHASVGCQIAI